MPNPTISNVHVNRPLTNISIAWKQAQTDFVAERVFPLVPVQKRSDAYYVYDRSYWFRSEVQRRAPGTESAGGGYVLTTDTYFADVYALHKDIDDQIRANEDNPLNSDRDAVEWLNLQFMLEKERQFASTYMTTSVWATDVTGVASSPTGAQVLRWSDAASNPIEDVRRYKLEVKRLTGLMPNVLTLGVEVYTALVDHVDIIDRIKYSGGVGPNNPARTTMDALAQLFEVDEIIVGSAVQNTAAEGVAASNAFIVGKSALLSYRPPRPGILIPSAGYNFAWTGYLGGGLGAAQISRFRMEHLKSDRIEGEQAYDMKVVSPDLGVFFNTIVA